MCWCRNSKLIKYWMFSHYLKTIHPAALMVNSAWMVILFLWAFANMYLYCISKKYMPCTIVTLLLDIHCFQIFHLASITCFRVSLVRLVVGLKYCLTPSISTVMWNWYWKGWLRSRVHSDSWTSSAWWSLSEYAQRAVATLPTREDTCVLWCAVN